MSNCILKMKNKPNYHIVYQTKAIDQNQQSRGNYRNDKFNHQGGYNGLVLF